MLNKLLIIIMSWFGFSSPSTPSNVDYWQGFACVMVANIEVVGITPKALELPTPTTEIVPRTPTLVLPKLPQATSCCPKTTAKVPKSESTEKAEPTEKVKPIEKAELIVLSMNGCPPCASLAQFLNRNVDVEKYYNITITKDPSVIAKYGGATSFPTIIIKYQNKERNRRTGYSTPREFVQWLDATWSP